jgi:hypothetical protein
LRTYWPPASSTGMVPSYEQAVKDREVLIGAKLPDRYLNLRNSARLAWLAD